MKKVMRFIKRRICPIMLALVIVFFSVVIPCAKVEAASVAVPVDGFTYFDLVHTLFYSTGFEASIMNEDGTHKTFTQEMYDELCDCFDIWCYQNFETTDADEIKDQLRAMPEAIVDGTVTVTKAFWEALKDFATLAYDTISSMVKPEDYINDSGYYTWGLLSSYGVPLPAPYTESSNLCESSCNYIFGRYYRATRYRYEYFFLSLNGYDVLNIGLYDGQYSFSTALNSSTGATCDTSFVAWPSAGSYASSVGLSSSDIQIYANTFELSFSATSDSASITYPTDTVPDVIWPQQDLAIDKVKNPTWDDAIASDVVVPGEVADTGVIAIDDSIPADSDTIPGTIPDDPAIPDESDDPAIPGTDTGEDELVSSDEIATLPNIAASAGDITKLFPFCIPFDLVALIKGMKAEQKPPVLHFEYYFKEINYTFEFTVDMTDFEQYIKIFRAGMVIFWIITLMFITIRYSTGIVKD